MKIKPIKTEKILPLKQSLTEILDRFIKDFPEQAILTITSKIVSICEGRVVKIGSVSKEDLIRREAKLYILPDQNKYNITLTITNNLLIPTAGIDESNGNGYFILWPKNPQDSANKAREYLKKRFNLNKTGVIITDSKTTPLRRGTTGIAIAHSGFSPLKNYIDKPDIFGRKLKVTKANIMDSLAAAAVLVMGEGNEQTPLAAIEEISFIEFQDRNPTQRELSELNIPLKDDLYAPLLKAISWQKGH